MRISCTEFKVRIHLYSIISMQYYSRGKTAQKLAFKWSYLKIFTTKFKKVEPWSKARPSNTAQRRSVAFMRNDLNSKVCKQWQEPNTARESHVPQIPRVFASSLHLLLLFVLTHWMACHILSSKVVFKWTVFALGEERSTVPTRSFECSPTSRYVWKVFRSDFIESGNTFYRIKSCTEDNVCVRYERKF